ncbi:MAG: DUF1573 domain-containing protein [Candidatus Hydrogenedentes bacterium]|nr:DUF1573 domain-containing protein [Candidatus Hydrogenedentota bacterium]
MYTFLILAAAVFGGLTMKAMDWANRHQGIDLGTVYAKGDQFVYTARFRNWGPKRLQLKDPRSSCGCTLPGVNMLELGPFEVASIPIAITVNAANPSIKSRVLFTVNDSDNPIEISLVGQIRPVMPRRVNVGQASRGMTEAGEFVIESTDTDELRVFGISQDPEYFKIRIRDIDGEPHRKHVILDLRDDVAPGAIDSQLVFRTTSSEINAFQIGVGGIVMSPVAFERDSISMGYVMMGDVVDKHVRLYSTNGKELTVNGLTCDLEGVGASIINTSEANCTVQITATSQDIGIGLVSTKCHASCTVDGETVTIPITVRGYVTQRIGDNGLPQSSDPAE